MTISSGSCPRILVSGVVCLERRRCSSRDSTTPAFPPSLWSKSACIKPLGRLDTISVARNSSRLCWNGKMSMLHRVRDRVDHQAIFSFDSYQNRITRQLHRLGASADWDRSAFTMNPALSKAVVETFCRLHEDGILYRANRLVNWCVALNTTLSNLEVRLLYVSRPVVSQAFQGRPDAVNWTHTSQRPRLWCQGKVRIRPTHFFRISYRRIRYMPSPSREPSTYAPSQTKRSSLPPLVLKLCWAILQLRSIPMTPGTL